MANIPKVLNDVLGDNYYILTKFSDLPYDSYWYLVIEESVYHRKPAILDINTYGIDSFPYKTTGHFVNLSGYDYSPGDGNPDQFRITDPFSKGFGNRWYNKGDLYQANYNHSNKAFIW